jgi:hypothetical protein
MSQQLSDGRFDVLVWRAVGFRLLDAGPAAQWLRPTKKFRITKLLFADPSFRVIRRLRELIAFVAKGRAAGASGFVPLHRAMRNPERVSYA